MEARILCKARILTKVTEILIGLLSFDQLYHHCWVLWITLKTLKYKKKIQERHDTIQVNSIIKIIEKA